MLLCCDAEVHAVCRLVVRYCKVSQEEESRGNETLGVDVSGMFKGLSAKGRGRLEQLLFILDMLVRAGDEGASAASRPPLGGGVSAWSVTEAGAQVAVTDLSLPASSFADERATSSLMF